MSLHYNLLVSIVNFAVDVMGSGWNSNSLTLQTLMPVLFLLMLLPVNIVWVKHTPSVSFCIQQHTAGWMRTWLSV